MASWNRASRSAFGLMSCCSRSRQAEAGWSRNFSASSCRWDAKLMDGKKVASEIRSEVKLEVKEFVAKGKRAPKLAVVLVGDDGASATYVRAKTKACKEVGILDETIRKPSSITQTELIDLLKDLNARPDVDGILCQLPVPEGMNERAVCDSISPAKDVDGFSSQNMGLFAIGQQSFVPATPAGVMELLKRYKVETFGKVATIAGRSKNVGFPLANLLHSDGRYTPGAGDATVLHCHRFTEQQDLETCCRMSDIIIVATGVVGLIRGDMIKPGATVVDIGLTRLVGDDGKTKIVGDVQFDEAVKVAGLITPVPGGVGPMTVAMLCKNTFEAYQQHPDTH